MNSSDYKTFHESYMRNNHGSNAVHTFFCIFFTIQCSLLCAIQKRNNQFISYLYEYLIIVVPLILIHTLAAQYIYEFNLLLAILLVIKLLRRRYIYTHKEETPKVNNVHGKRLQSISCIRGLTYVITSMCILAVDFKDFPRYLAKTERYGYSLMDTGVGLFVFISGLVHKDLKTNSISKILLSNIKFITILLVLGVSRYISIKQLNYHEHVTEYGVHWNFFFTLAFCKLFSTIILSISNYTLLLSFLLITFHETLLYSGLQEWVFSGTPRLSLLDANREGVSSNLGYVSIYIFAVHIKILLNKSMKLVLPKLILYSCLVSFLSYLINIFRPTSRTLANTGYCTFLVSVFLIIFSIMYFLEMTSLKKNLHFETPLIVTAVNNNGLLYFLLSNLLTGSVNLVFQTLLLSSSSMFIILNIYMILTLIITVYLNSKGFKI